MPRNESRHIVLYGTWPGPCQPWVGPCPIIKLDLSALWDMCQCLPLQLATHQRPPSHCGLPPSPTSSCVPPPPALPLLFASTCIASASALRHPPTSTFVDSTHPACTYVTSPASILCHCEGDTGTRPLIYRDTLRQGQAKQM